MNVRIRLEKPDQFGIIGATIIKYGKTGSISKKYLSKEKYKELMEYGYAYTNQPEERVV